MADTTVVFLRFDAYPHVPYDELTAVIQSVFPDALFHAGYMQSAEMHSIYLAIDGRSFAYALDVIMVWKEQTKRWENYELIIMPKVLDDLLIRTVYDAPKPVIPKR
ncbi:hypothetical protein HYS49_00210 [Candidatus Woesearchaeota archaeon]|nr:hypothetical protein [Candidatus Woesearchaeota archaeon]